MNNKKLSIIFMGTPEFAVPSLEHLQSEFGIKAVVTVPDKQKGRGLQMQFSAVKQKAFELNIPVYQPESLKDEDFIKNISYLNPDIMVVIAFRILPRELYSLASIGSFNIHGSLLPKYRGAAPINHAIMNGDKKTGLTSFLLEQKVDTGSILLFDEYYIPDGSTAGDVHDVLMFRAADVAVRTLRMLLEGNYEPIMQDDSLATPAPKIFPDQCRIDFSRTAEMVRNFVHAISPFPGAWCMMDDKRLKILRADFVPIGSGKPGQFNIHNEKMTIVCGSGVIFPKEVQLQAKRAMSIADFLLGYRGETEGSFS